VAAALSAAATQRHDPRSRAEAVPTAASQFRLEAATDRLGVLGPEVDPKPLGEWLILGERACRWGRPRRAAPRRARPRASGEPGEAVGVECSREVVDGVDPDAR